MMARPALVPVVARVQEQFQAMSVETVIAVIQARLDIQTTQMEQQLEQVVAPRVAVVALAVRVLDTTGQQAVQPITLL